MATSVPRPSKYEPKKMSKPREREVIKNEDDDEFETGGFCQWDHYKKEGLWKPMRDLDLKKVLTNGYFSYFMDNSGQEYLSEIPVNLDGMLKFEKGPAQTIFEQVDSFWSSEEAFLKVSRGIPGTKGVKVLYKRGILMYGPPGCGKSSIISMVMKDVIERGGIGIKFAGSTQTIQMIKYVREIQPKTKIVVVFEDVDQIMRGQGEASLLNVLDGVDTVLDNTLFLGTTNYIDQLSPRLLRPSRFDLKIELNFPEPEIREKYLLQLLKSSGVKAVWDIDDAVRDTEGMSFADLKELFISTCIFNHNYGSSIAGLRGTVLTEAMVLQAEQQALGHRMQAVRMQEKADMLRVKKIEVVEKV